MFLVNNLLDVNLIGGKGYKLVYFQQNSNLLIPSFTCVTSDFFIKYKYDRTVLEALKEELCLFLKRDKKYAVRSSAIDEDSSRYSFAGVHDSFLNVDSDDVLRRIFDVYESAFSETAISYRKNNNLSLDNIKMSVIIQEMVDADFAGVINTINPITDNPDELLISVVKGLGDGLVDGSRDGTNYIVNGNNVMVNGVDILNKKLLNKLVDFTFEIINKTEAFQDIEFAIKNNSIYFLQTRDITNYEGINPHNRKLFIDNANIIESYFGQTSYLTYTFAKDVYRDVYTCTLQSGKVRKKILKSLEPSLSEMLYYHNGRIYYNMNSWYHVNTIFPFKKSTTYMEQMMGVKSSSSNFKRVKMNFFDMIKLAVLFVYKVIRMDKLSTKFIEKFNKTVMPYYGTSINLSNEELKNLFNKIEKNITKDFSIPIINDCAVMIFYGLLRSKVNKMKNITNKEDLISKCISNNGKVESCGSSTELIKIFNIIKSQPTLLSDFKKLTIEQLYEKYHNINSVIFKDVSEYIHKFGSRVNDELKLETITMIEDNKIIYAYLKNMIDNNTEKEKYFTHFEIPKKLRFLSKMTKKFIKNRERLRLKRTYIYSVVRNIFLSFGRNYVNEGLLDKTEDIFYLTKQEVFNPIGDLKSIVRERKAEEQVNLKKPYYDRYVFYDNDKVLEVKSSQNHDGLSGIPSGAGVVTSKATIMNTNKDYLDKGNIIVTKRTDPGWISLFPLASGLVVEHGSMLSHSFVVAREMGLPAIVGVHDATKVIKTGDVITLDGVKGVVIIENKTIL